MQSAIASGAEQTGVRETGFNTFESRHWALRELARRAGVTPDQFSAWQIEFSPDLTVVWLDGTGRKCIRIASRGNEILRRPVSDLVTNFALWMFTPSGVAAELVPAFVVPYCPSKLEGRLIFRIVDENTVESEFDLLTAALLCLGRYEETVVADRDIHGRFEAKSSAALRDGFLDRPVVDEYGLALAQAIEFLSPSWTPHRLEASVKLSHDIDDVDINFSGLPRSFGLGLKSAVRLGWMALPLSVRSAVQQITREKRPLASMSSLMKSALGRRPNGRDFVRRISELSAKHAVDSAFYWKGSPLTPFDSGYDPRSARVRALISEVSALGFENGVHPGYYTFENLPELRLEVERLRNVMGDGDLGGRQHYLRWSPRTWLDWEECGLAYDSSLGYAEACGFRAGTCVPYKPWIVAENRESSVLEIPLLIMESTLAQTTAPAAGECSPENMLTALQVFWRRCSAVHGVFTLLFHNSSLHSASLARFYETAVEILAGKPRYDWRETRQQYWNAENWKSLH